MKEKLTLLHKYKVGDYFISKYPNGFKDIHRIIALTESPSEPYFFKGDDSVFGYKESEKFIDEHYNYKGYEKLKKNK